MYFAIAPGFGPYAVSIRAKSIKEARAYYAKFLGKSRCPKGTKVWSA